MSTSDRATGVAFPAVESQIDGLIEQVRTDSGFTVNPRDGVAPPVGYVVATELSTRVEPATVFFDKTGHTGGEMLKQYLWDNAATLKSNPALDVGVWYDRTRQLVVLSIVEVVADREAAIKLAQDYRQKAVYDLAARSDVVTGSPGR